MTRNIIRVFTAIILLFASMGFSRIQSTELLKQMVKFDQNYIPALALTNEGEREPSQKALQRLTKFWENFSVQYYNYETPDTSWQSDVSQITKSIAKANIDMRQNKSLAQIHNDLESIRLTFMNLRKRNDISYFPDHLTAFHGPMEHFLNIINKRKSGSLSETDIRDLSNLYPDIQKLWKTVMKASLPTDLFGFNQQQTKQATDLIKQDGKIIQNLGTALRHNNQTEIIANSKRLKYNFVKLYLMFGDFHGLK
ncbi:MAG TPA: hypothetical protein VKA34_18640 [Balneolales bacterium]|nr:hypothetical protein [Balneolales bacterium]